MSRIITLFLLVFSFGLQAQYERGNWYLSGNSAIDAGNQSTVAGSDFLPPSASRTGLFLLDRLLVGGNVLNPAVFVRYYQPLKPQSKLSAFAELNVAGNFSARRGGIVNYQPAIGLEYQLSADVLLSAKLQATISGGAVIGQSLQFGVNTVIGRSGLAPGQNHLSKGSIFIDPNIGEITLGHYNPSSGQLGWLNYNLHFGGGIMLSDRVSLDGSLSASNYRSEFYYSNPTSLYKATTIAADLGLRYFLTGKGKFRPYVGAGLNAQYLSQVVDYEDSGRADEREEHLGLSPYLKLGTLFFLSDNVALDASLEYNFRDNTASRAAASQLGLGVGVKIFLGNEKER